MEERVTLVEFTKKFRETNLAFDGAEWAQCLRFMAENMQNISPPIKDDEVKDD